ncbi:hypothetical protein ACQKNX_00945 [Lysinibacillus sp. NPDC093712]|uniref:hypothetical protein n=1 Tax=Lysinibacillus sp. NPDC093712 TaxID=3390579 RepID=UPI003D0921E7
MKKQRLFIFIFFCIPINIISLYLGYLVIWKKQDEWVPVTIYLMLIVSMVVVTLNNRK